MRGSGKPEGTDLMIQLTTRNQVYLGVMLMALMATTRSHHLGSLHHLPDASWAVFFLAGVYLRSRWVFLALCGVAALSDYIAITWGGVSAFCVSSAYAMLLPAYGVLWLCGQWYAARHADHPRTALPLAGSVIFSATVSELFSSGGFYFLSDRFVDPTLAEFGTQFVTYFPHNLSTISMYVALAAVFHAAFVMSGKSGHAARG